MLYREGINDFLQQSKSCSRAKPGLYVELFSNFCGSCFNLKEACVYQPSEHYNNLKKNIQLCVMIRRGRTDYHLQTKMSENRLSLMVKVHTGVFSGASP